MRNDSVSGGRGGHSEEVFERQVVRECIRQKEKGKSMGERREVFAVSYMRWPSS